MLFTRQIEDRNDDTDTFVVRSRGEARAYDRAGAFLGMATSWDPDVVEVWVCQEDPQVNECIKLNKAYNERGQKQ